MALIAYLYINDTPIGVVSARRLTRPKNGTRLPSPDEEHEYKVEAVIKGESRHGTVRHRYGDGAAALLAKASQAVE